MDIGIRTFTTTAASPLGRPTRRFIAMLLSGEIIPYGND
jgi:hypothetical protein